MVLFYVVLCVVGCFVGPLSCVVGCFWGADLLMQRFMIFGASVAGACTGFLSRSLLFNGGSSCYHSASRWGSIFAVRQQGPRHIENYESQ